MFRNGGQTKKPYVDLAIITPLDEEYKRVTAIFPILEETVNGKMVISKIDTGKSELQAVVALQDDMGKSSATRAANYLIANYDIGAIIVLGIAGGLSGDVAVGDVCVSSSIVDVLENASIKEQKSRMSIELNSIAYGSDDRLSFAVKYYSIGRDVLPQYEDWQKAQNATAAALVPGTFIGRSAKAESIGVPKIHEGTIICGAVSKSDIYKAKLKGLGRKVLAIETESGGVFHPAKAANIPVISIRGICDYADENKNRLEDETNGQLRYIAADNAVRLLSLQLENPQFALFFTQRRQPSLLPAMSGTVEAGKEHYVQTFQEEAHKQLIHLSPSYRGKPEGYRLPLPRVRPAMSDATVDPSLAKTDPIDILEAITLNRVLFVDIPPNYPDSSLAWIIAGELARVELHGRSVAPIVIDGAAIKPPSGKIDAIVDARFQPLLTAEDFRRVFIIENFNEASTPRLNILREEISARPDDHFVILQSSGLARPGDSRSSNLPEAKRYRICDISFIEIATFLQRNFSLPDQEASVVAYRLHQLFRRFDLNAHPSYFAGVAADVLSSLLKANRRSELIQLAVGGFLSFVVASDTDDVVLSRTTREAFLEELAFELNVNVRTFNRAQLVEFISEFAEKKDYAIDPIKFVTGFQEKGILDFPNDRVRITMPFIESYLLASGLTRNPSASEKYFDVEDDNFDFNTFDMYSEIGPSEDIVNKVVDLLVSEVDELNSQYTGSHILLSNELNPRYVERSGHVDAVKRRLSRALEDIQNNRDDSKKKQQILDLASRVEAEARTDENLLESAKPRLPSEEEKKTRRLFRVWAIATILLGAGSERLDKEPKRKLVSAIVSLTTVLLDRALREFPQANFEHLRQRMKSDDTLREVFSIHTDDEIPGDLRDFADTLVDAYEFSLLTMPLRMMFEHIGETAGQKVLRTSVASVRPEGVIDNLVARIWGAEIDAVKEKSALVDAIQKIPNLAFLRLALSNHLLARVFWDHWDEGNRLALLDAVTETLRPLSTGVDKGKIQRTISREGKPKKESEIEL